jgi:hypothetical protein
LEFREAVAGLLLAVGFYGSIFYYCGRGNHCVALWLRET